MILDAKIITSGKSINKVFHHSGFYVFLCLLFKDFFCPFFQPHCLLTQTFPSSWNHELDDFYYDFTEDKIQHSHWILKIPKK